MTTRPGHLFAALPGSVAHGGEFIQYALRQGAAAVLTGLLPLAMLVIGYDFGQREVLMGTAALPYALLALFPGLAERLPRPGPWMERLRQFLAFPMYGAVLWLAWVFARQTGGDVEAPDAVRRLCDHRRSDCQHQRGERG